MTKVKLREATKELAQDASNMLENVSRVKRTADGLVQSLRKLEGQFNKEEEQLRAKKKMEEQQKLVMQHQKAWTMPDEDEMPVAEKTATPKEEPVQATTPVEVASVKVDNEQVVEETKPVKEEAAPVEKEDKKEIEQPKETVAAKTETAAPVEPQNTAKPLQGQAVQQPRSVNPQGPYGRPVNPQGPYGRPANPQGPYGRPANPQGPYGRPANPQGPYGRPANPQAQGGFAPRPQGQGGFAPRPQGQGGFAPRPQGQGGFAPRPQGQGSFGQRPQGQGGFAPRPQGQGSFGQRSAGGARAKAPEIAPAMEKERVSNYDPNKKNYLRQHDSERAAKNKKQLSRENRHFNGYDDDFVRGKRTKKKAPSAQQMMAPIKIEKAYMTAETITVKDLTERIGKTSGEIMKKLLLLGIMATINSELDFDTASLVCEEFGVELELNLAKTAEDYLDAENFEDTDELLQARPPVITIMGHVDHGKTSLLDYIRKAHVTTGEAGGITQHIGAYTVDLDGRHITFLDTPGHEAFTAMRARGTQATDIAVLVVAADDGVMPQTIESINHAKASGVPVIVAINKMDKEAANPDRVMTDLTAHDLVAEAWGGDTIMVPVSAMTGEGVDQLLEMILLQADILQLRANPDRLARGVIIEAKLDKSRGPVATVLVQNGTLNVGDNIVAGMASGRVRAMLSDRGERLQTAGPSTPVEVSGFNDVPSAGDEMMAVGDDHLSRQVAQERRDKLKASRVQASAKVTLDNLFGQLDQNKITNLNIIVKADVQGSVEAVKQALEKLSNDEVKVRILHSAVGAITKDDVNLASAFSAIIIGFNIRPDNSAREQADKEKVDVRLYTVIYQAIEDVEKAMKGLLAPQFREVILGHAEVRNVFKITGSGTIAGSYIQDGKMQRNASVRLLRDNVVVFEGKLSSLKRFKDDAKEVAAGYECGMSLDGYNDIKEGDVVECFINEEIER